MRASRLSASPWTSPGASMNRAAMVVLKPYRIAEVAAEHTSAIASLTSQYVQT